MLTKISHKLQNKNMIFPKWFSTIPLFPIVKNCLWFDMKSVLSVRVIQYDRSGIYFVVEKRNSLITIHPHKYVIETAEIYYKGKRAGKLVMEIRYSKSYAIIKRKDKPRKKIRKYRYPKQNACDTYRIKFG